MIHSLIHPFFCKVELFIPAFRYRFVLKIFLAHVHVWGNNYRICAFFKSIWKFQVILAYETLWNSKTRIIHKRNLRIDWKFENKLTSSKGASHKNSMIRSQNGPFKRKVFSHCILPAQNYLSHVSKDRAEGKGTWSDFSDFV